MYLAEWAFPRPAETKTKTKIDLLRTLAPVLLQSRAKAHLGNCFCQNDDYVEARQAKYEFEPS